MPNLEKFSVLDSRFERLMSDEGLLIRKETRLNPKLGPYYKELQRLTDQYVRLLQEARIPTPKVVRSEADEARLLFVCEYKGLNILEFLEKGGLEALLSRSELLNQILEIIRKAQRRALNFDPHIKNFVVDHKAVYYVDFTPPWLQEYYDLRLSVATKVEQEILLPFYRCMEPENLGFHFCSDFLKMDRSNISFMPELHQILRKREMISGDYGAFLGRCEQIMNDELRRERQGVYLL